jgi:hypothetical protein
MKEPGEYRHNPYPIVTALVALIVSGLLAGCGEAASNNPARARTPNGLEVTPVGIDRGHATLSAEPGSPVFPR